jgi:uncharacterized ferritin-like protein (DUF455 family)
MGRSVAQPSLRDLMISLAEVLFFERASAHMLSGWIVKIPELETKVTLAQHFQEDMEAAAAIKYRTSALARANSYKLKVPLEWRNALVELDANQSATEFMSGLYGVVKPRVLSAYKKISGSCNQITHAPFVRFSRERVRELYGQLTWARSTFALKKKSESRVLRHRITNHSFEETTPWLDLEELLWPPIDRVPHAVRPNHFVRGTPGALRLIPIDSLENTQDIGMFLHGFLNEEYTTMELIARNSYEHPAMPWAFHVDAARHASDEARHASMIAAAAGQFGVKYGQYPVYTSSYDGQYQFKPCRAGSARELLWRILLRQTFHEGLALDSLAFEVEKRNFIGQTYLADLFRVLLSDEIFHAQSGLKWSRFLCAGDKQAAMNERQEAHEYFVSRVKESRAQFIARNMKAAIAEVKHLKKVKKYPKLPIRRTVNISARQAAGFTDEEIRQIVDWGYVQFEEDKSVA